MIDVTKLSIEERTELLKELVRQTVVKITAGYGESYWLDSFDIKCNDSEIVITSDIITG